MAYQIPLFKLNFDEKEALAAADTIRSGWISTGPKCEELEHIFVDMFHVSYAVAISNCTDALHLCCLVCGMPWRRSPLSLAHFCCVCELYTLCWCHPCFLRHCRP